MKIFDIVGTEVELNAQILGIPPFKTLWDRDKTKGKKGVKRDITFVTFVCDSSLDNPYRGYSDSDRRRIVRSDIVRTGLATDNWTTEKDEILQEAMKKFEEFQQTPSSRMLKSLSGMVDKLYDYYETIDFNALDSQGKPLFTSDMALSNIEKASRALKALQQLEKEVLREQIEVTTVRGGTEIGDYEIPRDDI